MALGEHHKLHENITNLERFTLIHSKKSVKILDRWVMAVGIISPLATIPQVYQLIVTKDARGVSAFTWFAYLVFAVFWLVYGVVHEDKPIVVNYVLWIIFDAAIVILALLYR